VYRFLFIIASIGATDTPQENFLLSPLKSVEIFALKFTLPCLLPQATPLLMSQPIIMAERGEQ